MLAPLKFVCRVRSEFYLNLVFCQFPHCVACKIGWQSFNKGKKKKKKAAMEREKSHCQILMTYSLQCEWAKDWVGARERREACTALSIAEFLEAQVKRKKVKKSHVPAERIKESYLFQDQFLLRTKTASWRVFGLLKQGSKSLGYPVQSRTDCSSAEVVVMYSQATTLAFLICCTKTQVMQISERGAGFSSFCHIDSFVT